MGWSFIPFEKAIEKVTYTKKIPRKKFLENGIYPIISQESAFINGYWNDSHDVFNVDSPVVIFGDHTKVVKHIGFDFVLGADGVKVLKPINELDSKFFAYFLESSPVADLGYARHYKLLKEVSVPLPPIPEQKRIVAKLDQAFAEIDQARAKTEQNLKNARELFESYLQQVFSQRGGEWVEKKFDEVCVLQRGFDLPKRLREKGKYPLVSSSGVSDSHIEAKVKSPGVVTGRSGSIGNVFYIEDDYWPLNTVLYIKEFQDNNEKFIYWLLRSFDLSRFSGGAGVPTLNRNVVHTEMVSVPSSYDEQVKLTGKLELLEMEIVQLESIYNKKIEQLDELKKSILQKAFTGELTSNKNKGAAA